MFVDFDHNHVVETESVFPSLLSHLNGELFEKGINSRKGKLGKIFITAGGNYLFEPWEQVDINDKDEYYLKTDCGQIFCLVVVIQNYSTQINCFQLNKGNWELMTEIGNAPLT